MTTPAPRPLPHDPYIIAVCEALTAAGLEPAEFWTSDGETVGTYCYLNAVITLDPSGTHDVDHDDIPVGTPWPHGLILIWEWHTGREENTERGALWMFAEVKADGSNEYPTWLPVHGDTGPEVLAEAARMVVDRRITPGHFHNGGYPGGTFDFQGRHWEQAAELETACAAWDTDDAEPAAPAVSGAGTEGGR